MTRKTMTIQKKLVIHAFIIFAILLTVTFLIGLYLGRGEISGKLTYSVENRCREKLDACSYRIQDLSVKYQEVIDLTQQKGILDENRHLVPHMVCVQKETELSDTDAAHTNTDSAPQKKSESRKKKKQQNQPSEKMRQTEDKKQQRLQRDSGKKKKPRPKQTNNTQKQPQQQTDREHSQGSRDTAVWDEIDQIRHTDGSTANKADCVYAIQLFSGTSENQARAAQKSIPVKHTRLVTGTVRGNTWYRVRYGCFTTKEHAEKTLKIISNKVKSPIIVRAGQ